MSDIEESKVDDITDAEVEDSAEVGEEESAEEEVEEKADSDAGKEPEKKKGGLLKLIIGVLVIGAVILVAYLTGLIDYLDPKNAQVLQEWIEGFGIIGYIIFILLYVVAAVFLLPASILTILAGAAFGQYLGPILALIAATIGATVAFVIARYIARDMIVSKFGKNPLFKKIDDGLRENGVSFLILTRLVPIFPYNVQNYIYGLTSIKIWTFALVSLITMAPGALIYAFMAATIVEEGFSLKLLLYFAGAGVALFLVSLIPKYIAKKKGIKLKEE